MKILAVGDVFLDRENTSEAFHFVHSLFNNADIVFGNCEGVYATQYERVPSTKLPLITNPIGIEALAAAPFTVMSLANNHALDGGYQALLAMRDALNAAGILTAGAGSNFNESHTPALIKKYDKTIAVLAYTSIFPHGYESRGEIPGLAVLRARTDYTPYEINEWHPGATPKITTIPHEADHAIFCSDIAKAKKIADIVLVSIHWGDLTKSYILTDHERRAARLALDAGADAILGHHHHLLRGIEFYKNKPILYGIGHFAFDMPNYNARLKKEGLLLYGNTPMIELELTRRFGEYRMYEREDYPLLPFHPEARLTMIASLEFVAQEVIVNVIPCLLDKMNCPHPLTSNDADASVIFEYLKKNCELEYLPTEIIWDKNSPGDYCQFQIKNIENYDYHPKM